MRRFRNWILVAAGYAALVFLISSGSPQSHVHAASSNVSNVAVVNTPNIHDPDNPARQAVIGFASVSLTDTAGSSSSQFFGFDALPVAAPGGSRLVIEYASLSCPNLPAGEAAYLTLETAFRAAGASAALSMTPLSSGVNGVAAGQEMLLYADPLATVTAQVTRTGSTVGSADCGVQMSGHTVTFP